MRDRFASTFNHLCASVVCLLTTSSATLAQGTGGATATPQGKPTAAVIELYTSQGCSSCPAADALLESYLTRSDVVALTFPVDYWDYLGWKDTLASPKFSVRQRSYAKERGDGRIYTPQAIINGLAHVTGSSAPEIDKAIIDTRHRLGDNTVAIAIKVDGGRIHIETGEATGVDVGRDATIWLAVIQRRAEVAVRSGENRGKMLVYHNVVRDLTAVGMWSGKPARFELARDSVKGPDARGCAVLVQSRTGGPIIGAAALATC
jgi:hypothetical protein